MCLAGGLLASSVSWRKLALERISAGLSFCCTEEDVGRAGTQEEVGPLLSAHMYSIAHVLGKLPGIRKLRFYGWAQQPSSCPRSIRVSE